MAIKNSKSILSGNKYNIEKVIVLRWLFKETNISIGFTFYSGTTSFQNQSGYFVFEKYKELHSQSTF